MLTLPEQITLIALRDEKGSVLFVAAEALPYALAAAAALEIFFEGLIEISSAGAVAKGDGRFDDPLIDETFRIVKEAGIIDVKELLLKVMARFKDLKKIVIEKLVSRGILKEEKKKIFGLVSKTVYPEADPEPERKLRQRIADYVFNAQTPDDRLAALVALLRASNLFEDVIPPDRIEEAKEKLEKILNRANEGEAIKEETARAISITTEAIRNAMGTRKIV